MSSRGVAKNKRAVEPTALVGEIIAKRFAVLEHLGGDNYVLHDMLELRRTVRRVTADGELVAFEAGPTPRRALPGGRLEAAWFALGELFDRGEDDVAVAEVQDYFAYNALLSRMASELP